MPLYRFKSRVVFFVHIPKTGGSSIEKALRRLGCGEAMHIGHIRPYSRSTPQHMHAEIYREMVKEAFYDYGFAIVRNPFDRIASEYKMRQSKAKTRQNFERWFEEKKTRYHDYAYVLDNHIRPQHFFLHSSIDVFRFEDGFESAIERACQELGIEPPDSLPHARKSAVGWIETSREVISKIVEFYRRDFEELNYATDSFTRSFKLIL